MSDTDAEFRLKIRALVKKLRVLQAQTFEIAEELERVLDANPTTGEQIKTLFKAWKQAWEGQYRGDTYVFTGGKDAGNFKRLLKTFPAVELEVRMRTYLGNRDPFYVNAKHDLGLFVSTINKHGRAVAAPDLELSAPTIRGCRHVPPCVSDQEHTQRMNKDIRNAQPF